MGTLIDRSFLLAELARVAQRARDVDLDRGLDLSKALAEARAQGIDLIDLLNLGAPGLSNA